MYRTMIRVTTGKEGDIRDITPLVKDAVKKSGIQTGLVHLFVLHSTAALTTVEFEEGVLSDLRRSLAILAPGDIPYAHDTRWGDGNGRSHVRAALVGPSLTIPLENGGLLCGTWQQVVLLELDVNAGRERTIVCTIQGES